MFRYLHNPNLTSHFLRGIVSKCLRKYSDCYGGSKKCCVPPTCCGTPKIKVTICGACGHLGQTLAFLLKQSPLVDLLSLYDMDETFGLAMDLSHIDTRCRVQAYSGCCEIMDSLIVSDEV